MVLDEVPACGVYLGLPPLHCSVPLPPGILSVHVGSLWHCEASRLAGNLPGVDLVIVCPLTILYLLLSPRQDGGVSLEIHSGRMTSSWRLPERPLLCLETAVNIVIIAQLRRRRF